MIGYLEGQLINKDEQQLLVKVEGIGYEVFVDQRLATELPVKGADVKLFIYQHIREDAQQLYGFKTLADKKLFQLLLSVSGIGPKSAMAFFSAGAEEIVGAIASGQPEQLLKIPGVGRKTAEKTIVELQDKIKKLYPELLVKKPARITGTGRLEEGFQHELTEALKSLGYSSKEIEATINKNLTKLTEAGSVEEGIKVVLRNI